MITTNLTNMNPGKKLTDQEVWMYHRAAICKAIAIGLGITIAMFCLLTAVSYAISQLKNI